MRHPTTPQPTTPQPTTPQPIDPSAGVFSISVASELTGLDQQSLRLYERRGLLEPARTGGGTRRYSSDDIDVLRHIAELLDSGINLAGIAVVLRLETENAALREQLDAAGPSDPGPPDA